MAYQNEEEFLKDYNPDDYDRISLTTDILILSISDEESSNYRKSSHKYMSVLLVKREDYPFKDKWCLPGGFLDVQEDLEDCPKRILAEETNLHDIYLEQLYTFGDPLRYPNTRVITCAYFALLRAEDIKLDVKNTEGVADVQWHEYRLGHAGHRIFRICDRGEFQSRVRSFGPGTDDPGCQLCAYRYPAVYPDGKSGVCIRYERRAV